MWGRKGIEAERARRPIGPNLHSQSVNVDQQSRDQTNLLENDDDVDRMDEKI